MRRASSPRTADAAPGAEPAQELADLLALAGSHRAEHVLALLRELLLIPSPDRAPDLMTLEQVAARLQVHTRTIRRAIDSGELEAVDLPFRGGLRVRKGALDRWFSEHTAVPEPAAVTEPAVVPERAVSSISARRSGRLELSDI